MDEREIRELSIDTIRGLAMDSVQKANSGHPGTAMALAPLAYTAVQAHHGVNPPDTQWPDRDRFVLSAGHACVLQYALLHLCGSDLGLDDLQQFRQWGSRTPGHPERGHTPGVEVTTGPLGQGVANAVGMAHRRALPRRALQPARRTSWSTTTRTRSARDGDLMEGISQEAASIAGHFGLGKLDVSTTTTTSRSTATTAISFDSRDHVVRFAPRAGTCSAWRTPRTSTR